MTVMKVGQAQDPKGHRSNTRCTLAVVRVRKTTRPFAAKVHTKRTTARNTHSSTASSKITKKIASCVLVQLSTRAAMMGTTGKNNQSINQSMNEEGLGSVGGDGRAAHQTSNH
jgi:hypothetical protein